MSRRSSQMRGWSRRADHARAVVDFQGTSKRQQCVLGPYRSGHPAGPSHQSHFGRGPPLPRIFPDGCTKFLIAAGPLRSLQVSAHGLYVNDVAPKLPHKSLMLSSASRSQHLFCLSLENFCEGTRAVLRCFGPSSNCITSYSWRSICAASSNLRRPRRGQVRPRRRMLCQDD
jgi:hypothetical protein